MICPHCGQEHPDNYQFCPYTSKKITKIACVNKKCPEYGKPLLLEGAICCPVCGESLMQRKNIDDSYSESKSEQLFPIYGITLGNTNIFNLGGKDKIDTFYSCYRYFIREGVYVEQFCKDNYISAISFDIRYSSIELPSKWVDFLEMSLLNQSSSKIEQAILKLKQKGFIHHQKLVNERKEIAHILITPDKKHAMIWYFESDGELEMFEVRLLKCSSCKSNDIEILLENDYIPIYSCNNCGYQEDFGHNTCPKCNSHRISFENGRLKCRDCDCVWDYTVDTFCPKCGSDIVIDVEESDGYKCCSCSSEWCYNWDFCCPKCNSDNTINFREGNPKYKCENCKHEWDDV